MAELEPLPFRIPTITLGALRYIDARDCPAADRRAARNQVLGKMRDVAPLEIFCDTAGIENTLRAARPDFDATLARVSGKQFPIELGDYLPGELVCYNTTSGEAVGGFMFFAPKDHVTDTVHRVSYFPIAAYPRVADPRVRVRRMFDVIEAYAQTRIDGPGQHTIIFRTARTRYFVDAVRNDLGDQAMAAWRAEALVRAARQTNPVVLEEVADPQLAGRTILTVKPVAAIADPVGEVVDIQRAK